MELRSELPPANESLPTLRCRMSFCSSCFKTVSMDKATCSCGSGVLIPYIDQRPLLLDADVRSSVLNLLEEVLERVNDDADLDLEELQRLTTEYLPWLTQLIKDSELAAHRKSQGLQGFRVTTLSSMEVLQAIREQRYPQ